MERPLLANGCKVIRYDDGPYGVITSVADLAEYIKQNTSKEMSMKRHIRMSLRALEGQVVRWPYEHVHVCFPTSSFLSARLISL